MRYHVGALLMVLVPHLGAAQRLPLTAIPEHYALHFTPDLDAERFAGRARIRVRVPDATDRIVLHAADLTVRSAVVSAGGQTHRAVRLSSGETLTLQLPLPIGPGRAELDISYSGMLNRDLRGFYISEANGRKYAVTQLEATDARRMFPAFDEPSLKATFAITVVVDDEDDAISNGPIASMTDGPTPATKTITFATTAPMSTYLVALAIGEFQCGGAVRVGSTPVRVCATTGQRHLTGFAMRAATATLQWLNEYFAIDYPFTKLDLVAIPDFAAGAMENTGAVFFREALLLVDDAAAPAARQRVAQVIAHELAHQWFGNLVTMRWWDDLWLNEGFATWMEARAVAAWRPDWPLDIDELQATHSAMAVDALQTTRPVRQPADTPEAIEGLFDRIAYEKSGAVLGMVESYVGVESFRAGVDAYIERYQYSNAAAEDFWRVMAAVTQRPVDQVLRSFVELPGVPLISIETACRQSDTVVTLSQERFQAGAAAGAAPAPLWAVPVCLETRGDGPADRCELLTTRRQTVTMPSCARWVMGNRDAEGYYRTSHSADALERLLRANAELDPDERLALVADQWALMRSRHSTIGGFLDVVRAVALDLEAPGVLESVASRLQFVHEYLADDASRPQFEAWVRTQFTPALDALANRRTLDGEAERRLALLWELVAGVGRDEEWLARARMRVDAALDIRAKAEGSATLLDSLAIVAALAGDARLWERYRAQAEQAPTPQARYRYLYALAAFRDLALIERTLSYTLSPAVRPQDRAALVGRLFDNPAARDAVWSRVRADWRTIADGLGGFSGAGRVIAALDAFCDPQHAAEIRSFFAAHPVPAAVRTLDQTLETVAGCIALRESQRTPLVAWLEARAASGARPQP